MNQSKAVEVYSIPVRYRVMENLHIVFWLLKDLAWCMIWKPLGILMIIPTLTISIVIAWNTRQIISERCHNIAVSLWIVANSYWMISEFAGFDETPLIGIFSYKHLCLIPFVSGLLILAWYYGWYRLRHPALQPIETLNEPATIN